MLARFRAEEAARLHLVLMLSLTFSTGVVDAVGFLALDRVFVGNMTGNVVILGMGAVGAEDLPVLGPTLALVGFLLGAAIGGRALRSASRVWSARISSLLLAAGAVSIVVGLVLVVASDLSHEATIALSSSLAVALGMQAAAARHLAVKDVTTVVVTSTLTGLAADSRFGNGSGSGTGRRTCAVVLLLTGAVCGGVAALTVPGVGLLASGAICLVVAALGEAHARAARPRGADRRAPKLTSVGRHGS